MESISDPYVFILKYMIILMYVDDFTLISKKDFNIIKFIASMKDTPQFLEFTEEGTMNSYLGVDISSLSYGKGFTFSQPFLIDQIIQDLGFDPKTTKGATKNTPSGYPLLNKYENGTFRNWHA